ncbi:MAG: imidazole glycerol phosphate synthase subunit HisH [Caulobacteraceae bacterium]|nr:imidazole glycerol phosphate synthase subunit HisH [Caulobacteraceae bacterium]
MQSVVLIDYGSGNLRSAEKALIAAAGDGARVVATDDPDIIRRADRVVLPGVGAFAACMAALAERPGVIEAMTEAVRGRGAPFLGICVGMQLLATRGLEFGEARGLDWIGGDVRALAPSEPRFKVPHMGWNALVDVAGHPLFAGLGDGAHMYFTHSFAMDVADPADVAARTDHGGVFTAAVAKNNIAGVQFHPEKSQGPGLGLLANFLEWRP